MTEQAPKETVTVQVRALVESVMRSGDLNSEFTGTTRNVEAIRAHREIQKSRTGDYQGEVPVSHTVEAGEFVLQLRGRIDGVFHDIEPPVIEEIKTVTRNIDAAVRDENPVHWAQVIIYAYIHATFHGLDEVQCQLTYFEIGRGEQREVCRTFSIVELEDFFERIVHAYIKDLETIHAWRKFRNESLEKLDFPYGDYRPGQRAMAVAVYRTIRDKGQLTAQAPTGIGKTMAVIFPAVKALAGDLARTVFYLTARTTGRTAAEKALADLRKHGAGIKAVTLTAKEKICFNPEKNCNAEECAYAVGHFDRVGAAMAEAFNKDELTADAIRETAQKHKVCPFELSLDLALRADFIIGDYNYVFDPKIQLKRQLADKDGLVFLVDEAHNLVDRSRYMYSAEIKKQDVLNLKKLLKDESPDIADSLGEINKWLLEARKYCEGQGGFLSLKEAPEELTDLLKDFIRASESRLASGYKASRHDDFLDLYFAVSGFIRIAEEYDDRYITCYEPDRNDLRLRLYCLDPSKSIQAALKRGDSAVFFSATLSPPEYFRKLFGCDETAGSISLASPFPKENLCLMVSDNISTTYRHREYTVEQVCRVIKAAISGKKGNYLVFFPSYRYMEMVCELFASEAEGIDIMVQRPGMTEQERMDFLEVFSEDRDKTLAAFSVMGGIFGEAIDLVGDRLTGAVIVGVGLPGISPERELIRDYFNEACGRGFEYAYMYPGLSRVFQAAGRVIRTEHDRGIVFLIDERFTSGRYQRLFPPDRRPVRVNRPDRIAEELKLFWNGHG